MGPGVHLDVTVVQRQAGLSGRRTIMKKKSEKKKIWKR